MDTVDDGYKHESSFPLRCFRRGVRLPLPNTDGACVLRRVPNSAIERRTRGDGNQSQDGAFPDALGSPDVPVWGRRRRAPTSNTRSPLASCVAPGAELPQPGQAIQMVGTAPHPPPTIASGAEPPPEAPRSSLCGPKRIARWIILGDSLRFTQRATALT
jgi:hypothetical protein